MPRHAQIVRHWSLLRALSRGARTAPELADLLQVTERTIYRDLSVLQEVRLQLYTERHDDGQTRWHLLHQGRLV